MTHQQAAQMLYVLGGIFEALVVIVGHVLFPDPVPRWVFVGVLTVGFVIGMTGVK